MVLQVHGVGMDDKRGITLCLTTTPLGAVLPLLLIYDGKTDRSLPDVDVRAGPESQGHVFTCS